jgi:ABC-type branched-subunit amino acid transport system permease subunit
MRGAASDPDAALSGGISLRRVHAAAWMIAGLVACVGGVFLGGYPNSVSPSISDVALLAFPAIILGGIGSTTGAITGGFVIGVVQELTAGYRPAVRNMAGPELLYGRALRRHDHHSARPALWPVRISPCGATMSLTLHVLKKSPARTAAYAAAIIGILLPFWVDQYWLSALVWVLIIALGALGLDVLTGRTGQISLGHAFFLWWAPIPVHCSA